MGLLARLALLFIGVPLLELAILVKLGQVIGFLPTVALVVVTGALGAGLARLEGLRTIWRIKADLGRARLPADALFDGLAVLLGGALLLTPGILTDLVGFSLLLPPSRRVLMGRVRDRLKRRLKDGSVQVGFFSGGEIGDLHPYEDLAVNPEDDRTPV
jgi:UPF0716 protein FxsA